jgi:hypothetical protein
MSLKSYVKFMREFSICPSIISEPNLESLYIYMANILKRSEGDFDPCRISLPHTPSKSVEEMDSHMFIESLAMVAITQIHIENEHGFSYSKKKGYDLNLQKILIL